MELLGKNVCFTGSFFEFVIRTSLSSYTPSHNSISVSSSEQAKWSRCESFSFLILPGLNAAASCVMSHLPPLRNTPSFWPAISGDTSSYVVVQGWGSQLL